MKLSLKTICLAISGICLLFVLVYMFNDSFRELFHGDRVFFAALIMTIVFAILAVAFGKQEHKNDIESNTKETGNDYAIKIKQAKELHDSGAINDEEYQALVDKIISNI